MDADRHTHFTDRIDELVVAGWRRDDGPSGLPQDASLRAHLASCIACQSYLDATERILHTLNGFSFEIDPSMQLNVQKALHYQAQAHPVPLPPARNHPLDSRRLLAIFAGAVALTFAGSVLDLRLGSLFASLFNLQVHALRQDLVTLWIGPSLLLLLLFPLLPLLSRRRERAL